MRELFGILLLFLAIWAHHRLVLKTRLITFYFPALLGKLIAGIGVGLLYTYYYAGGDTWNYFNQAILFGEVGFLDTSNFYALFVQNKYELISGFNYVNQPRAALMVKVVASINVLTGSNYWVTSLFFSFFSFIGIYQFANWINKKNDFGYTSALSVFIWPSFLFWSSGILKETLAIGLIFFIIPTFFEAIENKSNKKAILVVIGFYLLFLIKYYFASVLIVTLLLYAISKLINLQAKAIVYQIIVWCLMLTVGFLLAGFMHYNLRFENILGVILENNNAFAQISSEHSLIEFRPADQPWLWLVINTPKALFASLFLPLNPSHNILFFIASLENWLLIGLLIRGLMLLNKASLKKQSVLLLASFTYIITLAVFLALSTPNLGTLSRYKVSFIPIVLVLVVLANRLNFYQENKQKK